jgi:adenine/guanine phosphoribosyltransferase-like PRPP-binding protein
MAVAMENKVAQGNVFAASGAEASFVEPTTRYWQDLSAALPERFNAAPPYRYGYPARLPCGRFLVLPLRRLASEREAVASLIVNQASHAVAAALAEHMAEQARRLGADLIVGLPTLGLGLAAMVSQRLGHARYLPLGYSRKLWYDERLSEPVSSITSPGPGKRLYLDPNMRPLLADTRRVVLIDDAVSTGRTALAAWRLLRALDVDLAGIVVAMMQTIRWQTALAEENPTLPTRVRAVFGCPLFRLAADGWWPVPATEPAIP